MQNISAIGMIKKILGMYDLSNFVFLVPALFLFGLQYIKINLYNDLRYQLGILASALIFIVLFSSGSESCIYIIAMSGFVIWFILQEKPYNKYVITLLVLAILLSVLGSSDLAPAYIKKEIVRPYALKALPFLITWLTLVCQLLIMKKAPVTVLSNHYLEEEEMPSNLNKKD
ncbi:hypothetical protein M2451_001815 [Dysgonomonas sp. PFB1-18]|nr:hypothetical protein [Dysgonomonas sp. PF1-14]MDH6338876.1 hypothetical protein [Dysgonomonas sp. PF1-16]MDH6380493.1 hypothetical protein [Dysgonomonas sp. PFB1-18]MDH6397704.1 hypothetical protein [Dysgonomonas sp. PF1-23]